MRIGNFEAKLLDDDDKAIGLIRKIDTYQTEVYDCKSLYIGDVMTRNPNDTNPVKVAYANGKNLGSFALTIDAVKAIFAEMTK